MSQQDTITYGVSPELISALTSALLYEDFDRVHDLIEPLHIADVADLIQQLGLDNRRLFIEVLRSRLTPELFGALEGSIRQDLVQQIGGVDLAKLLDGVNDEALLMLVKDMTPEHQQELLSSLPKEKRHLIEEFLSYPPDSAGRLMQRSVVAAPPFWTVQQVLDDLVMVPKLPSVFYTVFVVDANNCPIGSLPLNRLLGHDRGSPVHIVMNPIVHAVPVGMDQEKVAHMFRHYALVTAPVINESGRMVGVICMDDILHVLHKEATEDMLKLGGVSDPDFHASILRTSYTRIRWLIFTFLNTLIASSVLMQFEKTLEKSVALAILMPIVAAMGGNQGMQVVTVVVRALATGQIRMGNIFKVFFKEFSVGIINGVFFGTILGTIASGWFHSPKLGIILAIAMLFNMAWAAFAGTLVPVIFERLGFDPAISSGPVLTTTTDVLGFTAFLGLSTLFLFN